MISSKSAGSSLRAAAMKLAFHDSHQLTLQALPPETRYRRVKKEMDKVQALLANVRQESG